MQQPSSKRNDKGYNDITVLAIVVSTDPSDVSGGNEVAANGVYEGETSNP